MSKINFEIRSRVVSFHLNVARIITWMFKQSSSFGADADAKTKLYAEALPGHHVVKTTNIGLQAEANSLLSRPSTTYRFDQQELFVFSYLVIYLSSFARKRRRCYTSSLRSYQPPVTCLPLKGGGITLSAFPNGTTRNLAGSFMLNVKHFYAERQAGKL